MRGCNMISHRADSGGQGSRRARVRSQSSLQRCSSKKTGQPRQKQLAETTWRGPGPVSSEEAFGGGRLASVDRIVQQLERRSRVLCYDGWLGIVKLPMKQAACQLPMVARGARKDAPKLATLSEPCTVSTHVCT